MTDEARFSAEAANGTDEARFSAEAANGTDEAHFSAEAANGTDEAHFSAEAANGTGEVRAVPVAKGSPASDGSAAELFGQDVRDRAARIIARYPQPRSALLPLLHLVQSVEGYVSQAGVQFCAEQLDLGVAEVSAVVTFYTMYKRKPCGEHLVSVCTNTLCAALGGDAIFAALKEELGVGHEETAGEPGSAGSVTIEHVECLAACDFAPVLQVNYEFFDNQTAESAVELVRSLRKGERPAPTRGAPLTDFKTVEFQLAGFFEGRESDVAGPSAAEETLRGARLAEERGWTAPAMPEDAPLPQAPEKK